MLLSLHLAAFVYHGFLTHAECDHLTKIGDQRVRGRLDQPCTAGGGNMSGEVGRVTCVGPLFSPLVTMQVHRSLVVDAKTGGSTTDDIRTSYGAAFG